LRHEAVLLAPSGDVQQAVARILSPQLDKELGVPMIVDNHVGANAGIAAEYVHEPS
jgi:tripartite-type tricarboxylate transporter receptor subunit TctC